ncbi:right-handed parallel beta-helix repeat-containing protein [Sphingomonas sp. R-74633]|uniref:right-handed parallel beta-helix repeat-containing protein n=1 Tax=Sphingomonas sp. R-74633 TaxID=2751188 RepID=UPI0015D1DF80|nr:right-handed parallel beta-helix repeat-containing protein [Sphingomonas sp. R-74633]NYT42460.1 right-handed parallel beta-helix repeat-containing protein [Sphingomonas sp. R-74633]
MASVLDFIPSGLHAGIHAGTDTTDLTSYIQTALDTGEQIFFPHGVYHHDQLVVTLAGTGMLGEGHGSVLRNTDPTANAIDVRASYVRIAKLRLEGTAEAPNDSVFAIFTSETYPAPHLHVVEVEFSSNDPDIGFINGLKFETGADFGQVRNCFFERLWGTESGYGYGVLAGAVTSLLVDGCVGLAAVDRGRHFVYLSAGVSYARVTNNFCTGFQLEGLTINTHANQPASIGNVIEGNTVLYAVTIVTPESAPEPYNFVNFSAISIFGNSADNLIANNVIQSSGGCGIKIDGTDNPNCKNNCVIGNQIRDSDYVGIDVVALTGGVIANNQINESSLASPGTHPNINLAASRGDDAIATSDILVSGNRSLGDSSRAAFRLDPTSPAPVLLKVTGNKFSPGTLTDVDLNGVPCAIDDRIRFADSFDPPSIPDGSSYSTGFAVAGAEMGDVVTVTHAVSNADGCTYYGYVNANDQVTLIILNNSGAAKNITSGTLNIDVWKRRP